MIEYLREENRVLREQLGERHLRLTDSQRRRLAARATGLGRKLLAEVATMVTPETLLRWHPTTHYSENTMAAESVAPAVRAPPAILSNSSFKMAEENRDWGYCRIQGTLSNLGHKLARSTIATILARHGIEPAPERTRKTTWKDF